MPLGSELSIVFTGDGMEFSNGEECKTQRRMTKGKKTEMARFNGQAYE